MIAAPWEEPTPEGTHRVVGTIASIAYVGPWQREAACVAEVARLQADMGGAAIVMRIESRADVAARRDRAEQARLLEIRRRLDSVAAPTMVEIEATAEEAERAYHPPVALYPGGDDDAPPFGSVKQALGDYAAHRHGPMLAQVRAEVGGQGSRGAWLVVGSALSAMGLLPGDPRRERIVRWSCSADDRDGATGRRRLTGSDWDVLRRLRAVLEAAGVLKIREEFGG